MVAPGGQGKQGWQRDAPSLARAALDRYLAHRRLPTTLSRWDPATPLVACLEQDAVGGFTATRLWPVLKRFFAQVAVVIEGEHPAMADKLRRASPHWMRHTHATYALERGAAFDGQAR